MKTFLECLKQAAQELNIAERQFIELCIHDAEANLLQRAADIYAEQQAASKLGVMQAEASASAQGAAVGKERRPKGVSGGVYCGCDIPNRGNLCYRCSKLISDDRAMNITIRY